MRSYYLLIIGAFIITFKINAQENKQNLLKEVISFYDVIPKEVVYKNKDLKVVLTEEYDEYSQINESYEFDPNTGKKNGAFVNKPFLPLYDEGFRNGPNSYDFENHTNEGSYSNGILTCENYIHFLNERFFLQGKIINGHLDGVVSFYRIDEGVGIYVNPALRNNELVALSIYYKIPIDYYIKSGNGEFSKSKIAEVNYSMGTIVDGNYKLDSLTTVQYKNGIINGIIRRNEQNVNIAKDSLFRDNEIWKINNKYVKRTSHYEGPSFDPVSFFSEPGRNSEEIIEVDELDYNYNRYYDYTQDFYDNYVKGTMPHFFANTDTHLNTKSTKSIALYLGFDFLKKNKLNKDGIYLEYDVRRLNYLYDALFQASHRGHKNYFSTYLNNFKNSSFAIAPNYLNDWNYEFLVRTSESGPSKGEKYLDLLKYSKHINGLLDINDYIELSVFLDKNVSRSESKYVFLSTIFNPIIEERLALNYDSEFFEIAEFRDLKKLKTVPPTSVNQSIPLPYSYQGKKKLVEDWEKWTLEDLRSELGYIEEYLERYFGYNDLEGLLNIKISIDESGNVSLEEIENNGSNIDVFVKNYSSAISKHCRRYLPAYANGKYVKSFVTVENVIFQKSYGTRFFSKY